MERRVAMSGGGRPRHGIDTISSDMERGSEEEDFARLQRGTTVSRLQSNPADCLVHGAGQLLSVRAAEMHEAASSINTDNIAHNRHAVACRRASDVPGVRCMQDLERASCKEPVETESLNVDLVYQDAAFAARRPYLPCGVSAMIV